MSADLLDRTWDVVVIGTGIGGGTIGRRLAERGLSVLFLEKGPMGREREQHYLRTDLADPVARQVRSLWPKPVVATLDGKETEFFGAIGSGVGGTSSFYAATLERPEPHDIDDDPACPHPTGGWPVRYDDFRPYFRDVESLYEVCGDPDPLSASQDEELRPPPPLTPGDRAMAEDFVREGLHPYHVHMAVRFLPGCKLCFGRKCPRRCKLDGRSAGVEPALETGNAYLVDMCEVRAIRATRDRVQGLEVSHEGKTRTVRARTYVLAGGAFGSPRLLLSSRSDEWPEGIGNRHDLVGRNLMFHLTEMVAVWQAAGGPRSEGPSKALALRDFYKCDDRRFGAFQAIGVDASYGMIVHYLNGLFDRSALRRIPALRELTRIPALIAAKIFGAAKIFAGIIEDMPYPGNRVLLDPQDPERIRFVYDYPEELHQRRRLYRKIVRERLATHRTVFLTFQPDLNLAHCCGTLRFGDDPVTSVLDTSCRVHGMQDLYVVDASFMPTSLGINPSLTIAANALRVADRILERHRQHSAVAT